MQPRFLALILPALCLASCAWFGGNDNTPDPGITNEATDILTPADYRARLEAQVAQEVGESGEANKNTVIRKRPYYYKEYAAYPNELDADIEIIDQESRAVPYLANVTLDKTRFSTRLHRDSSEAESDDDFFRDTGTETITYEWRNGDWRRISSFFVADKTEELVNGQWVAVQEEPERTVLSEEPSENWFNRALDTLTFWR